MKIKTLELLSIAFLVVVMVGCSGEATVDLGPGESAETEAQPAAAPTSNMMTGTVVETMDAASYTYVRVDLGTEEIWAASSQFEVAVGDRVSVPLEAPMENFRSDTLDRDFPLIYFASRIFPEGEEPTAAMPSSHGAMGGMGAMGGHGSPSTAVIEVGKVDPPEGGMAVDQVWADRESLAGQTVTIAGQVVKFNGGILGTNWIHIQDGSGSAAEGNNDITVTSAQGATVGDVVTVTGEVVINQDFGAGYTYTVMIKDATVAAQ